MLTHGFETPTPPARAVVMGGRGFVGAAVVARLRAAGIPVEAIGRDQLDLLAPGAAEALAARLRADDTLVAVSALAPCKTPEMLAQNLSLASTLCAALTRRPVAHVVNISSDAVYDEGVASVGEATPAAPNSLHGVMHLAREVALRSTLKAPLCVLRPSLLYGARDPHNGYGPNRFRRLAAENKEITLFGEGEELRDHVFVEDVAEVVTRCVQHRSAGLLNVATGRSWSFREAAEKVVALSGSRSAVVGTPRKGPIKHRHFDVAACLKAFPTFHYTSFEDGLRRTLADLAGGGTR